MHGTNPRDCWNEDRLHHWVTLSEFIHSPHQWSFERLTGGVIAEQSHCQLMSQSKLSRHGLDTGITGRTVTSYSKQTVKVQSKSEESAQASIDLGPGTINSPQAPLSVIVGNLGDGSKRNLPPFSFNPSTTQPPCTSISALLECIKQSFPTRSSVSQGTDNHFEYP